MIYEKWGGYGNAERRTQLWRQVVLPPGEARSDVWQMMEFSKRFTLADILLYCWLDFGNEERVGQPLDPANTNIAAWFARVGQRPSVKA